jgi:hypothetical protein
MAYKEDLKDGRWQEMRLRIMERDSFSCRSCKSKSMLHVHHLYYKFGLKPWEYPSESLVTLCDYCHSKIHNDLSEKAGIIAFEMLTGKPIPEPDPEPEPMYVGVDLNMLLRGLKIYSEKDLTNEWNFLRNKINNQHGTDKVILDCSMLELKSQSEIIIYYDNNLQKQFIEKFLIEIITHFRTAFSNVNIIVILKNIFER